MMICIGTGKMVHDERRMRYTPELYFKSSDEMRALFPDHPEAITNTLEIAERCNLELEFGRSKYPDYPAPEGKTREGYLRELCYKGLHERYGERATTDSEVIKRLDYEVDVLEKTGFVSYLLIVWDFIHFAKERGIPVGPGRGSAAGSMAAYVLGITDVDPLQFNLLFERFLNPDRISPPDIDVDFCEARRGEVLDYVRQKYGERRVSQIITFGKLKAKSVIRDVGRVIGLSYGEADRLAKMIPNELGYHPRRRSRKMPELKRAIQTEERTNNFGTTRTVLEGFLAMPASMRRELSSATGSLTTMFRSAVTRRGSGHQPVCDGPADRSGPAEDGFPGTENSYRVEDTVTLIREQHSDFSLESFAFEDAATFALLNRGETIGLFQLESGGMAISASNFDVNSIDDIIALIALYRPGPMELIPDYIKRKKGQTKIKYEHPLLEEVCANTYGIMIYQEQVRRPPMFWPDTPWDRPICSDAPWGKRTRLRWQKSALTSSRDASA